MTVSSKDEVFEILKETINLCEKHNIQYWVVGGFAVDAKRGYISRDHGDIDLCIHTKDMNKCLKAFFKEEFKITKEGMKSVFYKKEVKIDMFELVVNGKDYERKREWFTATYPKEMFDNAQILSLEGINMRIPSNEGLRYYGSKTVHYEDTQFTHNLPYDETVYNKIEYKEFADYKEAKKNVRIEMITFS